MNLTSEHLAPQDVGDLPTHIQLVWHGVNDEANLRQCLASDVAWAELDVCLDPDGATLVLRHDTFREIPRWQGEKLLTLREALARLLDRGKSIKIDFKIGGPWIGKILAVVDEHDVSIDRLWLNGSLDVLTEPDIRGMAQRYPAAIIQIPLSSFAGVLADTASLEIWAAKAANWGINRFSIGWHYPDASALVDRVQEWGYEANIYGVRNLDEFLQAVALQPQSVTADFNFPEWHYYGRGSGHKGEYYAYTMHVRRVD